MLHTFKNPLLSPAQVVGDIEKQFIAHKNITSYEGIVITARENVFDTKKKKFVKISVLRDEAFRNEGLWIKTNTAQSILYDVESFTYSDDDNEEEQHAIVIKDNEGYKDYRRKYSMPVIQYNGQYLSNNYQVGDFNGLVIFDIDFKKHSGELLVHEVLDLQQKLIEYFMSCPYAVFLFKTTSGIGFHLAFATDIVVGRRSEYALAYHLIKKELLANCAYKNLESLLDDSVVKAQADFYLALTDLELFKEPTEIVHIEQIATPENRYIIREHSYLRTYQDEFRLFLAYKYRDTTRTYFDSYEDWMKMVYCVYCTFPDNQDRAMYWFDKLSGLSPKYKPDTDCDELEKKFDNNLDIEGGVNGILNEFYPKEVINVFPDYSIEDLKEFFQITDALPDHQIKDDALIITRYINEQSEQIPLSENLVIVSPPNTGKSTFLLSQREMKIIYLVPTKVLLMDLAKKRTDAFVLMGGVHVEDCPRDARLIIGTYDSMYKLLYSPKIKLSEYTLVIDEAHDIFCSAKIGFRYPIMRTIVDSLQCFNNFICLSGTWIDFPFTNLPFKYVHVRKEVADKPMLEIVFSPDSVESLTDDILKSGSKQICLVNDKKLNTEIKELIHKKNPEASVVVMNADTKEESDVMEVLSTNSLPPNATLLCTQIGREGISFCDDDITHLRFTEVMLPEHIAQFSFRARSVSHPPGMLMYIRKGQFKLGWDINYQNEYNNSKKYYEAMMDDVKDLPKKPVPEVGANIYMSAKDSTANTPILNYPGFEDEIDSLLLGKKVLDGCLSKFSKDIFSLVIYLRKWNFRVKFSERGENDLLKTHRKEIREEQVRMIEQNFKILAEKNESEISQDNKFLFRAWCLTQCIDPKYFLEMEPQDRSELFTDNTLFKQFVISVALTTIRQGVENLYLNHCVQLMGVKDEVEKMAGVNTVNGYPDRIYHDDLCEYWGESEKGIKSIKNKLKNYYVLSDAKVDANSKKYFSVNPKEMPYQNDLLPSNFQSIGTTPFSK